MFIIFAKILNETYVMARPQNDRVVKEPPLFNEFKPIGVPARNLAKIFISLDEYEAIRLSDQIGYSHLEASEEMNISRSTFSRLIEAARKKMADFIIRGKILSIEGGNIHFTNNIIKCQDCGYIFNIKMSDDIGDCPECHSSNLVNLAGGFGHGRCCVESSSRVSMNRKMGGKNAKRRQNRS